MSTLSEIRARLGRSVPKPEREEVKLSYDEHHMWRALKVSGHKFSHVNAELLSQSEYQLHCPHCNGGYMHALSVDIYDRPEDGSSDRLTVPLQHSLGWDSIVDPRTQTGTAWDPADKKTDDGNPSDRRTGIAIDLVCELCLMPLRLGIAQDRGRTLMGWK